MTDRWPPCIVYISIGNSDDKLTQSEWAGYWSRVDTMVRSYALEVIGAWVSPSTDPYQNACWAIVPAGTGDHLRWALADAARDFRQDSIAWAEAPETLFLGPAAERTNVNEQESV